MQTKLWHSQLARRNSNILRCLIGLEACSGALHIGRMLSEIGHDVRLILAQYVKPSINGYKNDNCDEEANAEAVS